VKKQSLSKWWESPASFDISVLITSVSNQETPTLMSVKLKEGAAKEFDVKASVRALPFRDLRPGETDAMMRNQLRAVLTSSISSAFSDFSLKAVDQGQLDKLTRGLGEVVGSTVNLAMLFDGAVTVSVKMAFDQAEGETTHLPSGDVVIVPKYSYDLESPRLNAFLGIFAALGLQGSFSGWTQAVKNRIMVI